MNAGNPKTVRVATPDRTFVVYEQDETRKIDVRKQADGIVAQLVHSFDAAHTMLTVNRLQSEGVHHFAMVHDSFGVHAGDIDLLNRVLREEFVRIYSEPVYCCQSRSGYYGNLRSAIRGFLARNVHKCGFNGSRKSDKSPSQIRNPEILN